MEPQPFEKTNQRFFITLSSLSPQAVAPDLRLRPRRRWNKT
jgi:hypothetical protein